MSCLKKFVLEDMCSLFHDFQCMASSRNFCLCRTRRCEWLPRSGPFAKAFPMLQRKPHTPWVRSPSAQRSLAANES